jgi:hypothetical protein
VILTRKILIQLDCDSHPSSFDGVVAVDAGVDFLFQYGGITPENVEGLVHGAMFTRGPDELQHTAIFIGGSDVSTGEAILKKVKKTLFDPLRVSVVLDCNGCNSTASAAVICATRHLELANSRAVVLGATGAVGQRVAQLLVSQGASVSVGSRDQSRAESLAQKLKTPSVGSQITSFNYSENSLASALEASDLVFGCGAAGVELLSEARLNATKSIKVAIDLNAVPPLGLGGIKVTDKAVQRDNRIDYGALGVGGLKMKIHKAVLRNAFQKRGSIYDAPEMFELSKSL